ncbi:uncharacterized protein RJT21DRAFT_43546 [Scheffersomyces amazonensis]|uniref:uncharacterized protein n=1 Tax=Scheffersomyces amazonensis TaxID=1078765 RepID=UPI00315CAF71
MLILYKSVWTLILFISWLITPTLAKRALSATSLVTCMQGSQISPSYFNVTFNPDDRSLTYSLDLATEISSYVLAHVQVYAYGFLIIEKDIDMCTLGWKQFCPVYPGSMQIESIEYISEDYVKMIPGIAYQVPDIDAVVKVVVRDRSTGVQLSCLQAGFSNGKTISQTGAKWATAVIAGLGLLIAAILSTFGNSNAASHISANAVSLFLYFQSVVLVSMQSVERVPPIASAWAENLAWSMGLIKVQFMQDIFRWYVQSTGGTPTTYFVGTTTQILVQRAVDYLNVLHDHVKRSLEFGLESNANLVVLRGIKRIGYNSHIEPTSIVVTGFTFFILIGYLLVFILVIIKSVLDLLIRSGKLKSRPFTHFRLNFSQILKGSILRYIYIGFTQLIVLSLWEFVQRDSPAVIVLAILFLLLPLSVLAYSYYKTLTFGKKSIQKHKNPAAILYGDGKFLNKFGYCYTMFHANKYWFGVVILSYNFIKGIFIAFCQGSGKASALILFIVDLAYTAYLIYVGPYLNKPTNILNYLISIVTTLNSFLFIFFSDLFGQPASVASIMGWVFFILNAAFSLILLVFIIVLIVMSIISKNPDARFAPAKDDRSSFQRKSSIKHRSFFGDSKKQGIEEEKPVNTNGELAALGLAAQDHATDWEAQMYKLNDLSGEETSNNDIITPSDDGNEYEAKETSGGGFSRLKSMVARKLSTKRHIDSARDTTLVSSSSDSSNRKSNIRMSDTLIPSNGEEEEEENNDEYDHFDESINHTAPRMVQHNRNESNFSSNSINNGPTHTTNIV